MESFSPYYFFIKVPTSMIRKLKFLKKNISILVKEYHKNEKICQIVKYDLY